MKPTEVITTILLLLAFTGCNKKPIAESEIASTAYSLTPDSLCLFDIFSNTQYGESHSSSTWAGRDWEVLCTPDEAIFVALTTAISVSTYDSICELLTSELGQPTYDLQFFPKNLIPKTDTGTYWMMTKCNDKLFYWCNDSLVVGFSMSNSLPDGVGQSYLSIEKK